MIPDEAVEAAARQLFDQDKGEVSWGEVSDEIRNYYRYEARKILEAAAPHLMAAAWEEGRVDGRDEERSGYENADNPYRITK